MSRFAFAMTVALGVTVAILSCVASASAAPVEIVSCGPGEIGGLTFAEVSPTSQDQHDGSFPGSSTCGTTGTATPQDAMVAGSCPINQMISVSCSATASETMSATPTATVGASGATLTALADGHASASISTSDPQHTAGNQLDSHATMDGDGGATFKVNEPVTFQISGSVSTSGQNGSQSGELTLSEFGTSNVIFTVTSGSNAMTGTLQPGEYRLVAFTSIDASAHFNSTDPSTASSQSSAHAQGTLTITAGASCPPAAVPSVQIGDAAAEGCFTERQDGQGHGTGVFETDQEAWIGGFDLKPEAGVKLVIEPSNLLNPIRSEGGTVDWVLSDSISVPAALDQIKPFTTSFNYVALNTEGTLERLLALPLLQGASAQVKVTWTSGGGGSKVDVQVSIADLSKNVGTLIGGNSVGTLAGSLTLVQNNNTRVDLSAASLQIPEFAEQIKETDPPLKLGFGGGTFSYSQDPQGQPMWSGQVTTLFPFEDNQGTIKGTLSIDNMALSSLALDVQGFEEPIGKTGWDWTGVHGAIGFAPDFAFDVGIDAQQHARVSGQPVLKLSGSAKLFHLASQCTNGKNPLEVLATMNSPTLESKGIGTLSAQVDFCAYLQGVADFAFEAGVSATLTVNVGPASKLVTASGSATGWFQGTGNRFLSTDFNLDGTFSLNLPVIGTIGGKGVISSEGYAFCATYHSISVGFATNNWTDAPSDILGCDFTPYRVAQPAASDAAATGSRAVTVPAEQRVFALAVRGATKAPRVQVLGPAHERFPTPTGARPLTAAGAVILPIDQLRTTYVYLRHPHAGRWRITPMPGSAAVTRVDSSLLLPKPKVSAVVKRRAGDKVRLRWRARAIRGQRVELLDRAAGVATIVQRLTSKRSGTVTFTPLSPSSGRRAIEADVFQNGRPRAQLTVLHYRPHVG